MIDIQKTFKSPRISHWRSPCCQYNKRSMAEYNPYARSPSGQSLSNLYTETRCMNIVTMSDIFRFCRKSIAILLTLFFS